jgi:hypothetical protein
MGVEGEIEKYLPYRFPQDTARGFVRNSCLQGGLWVKKLFVLNPANFRSHRAVHEK